MDLSFPVMIKKKKILYRPKEMGVVNQKWAWSGALKIAPGRNATLLAQKMPAAQEPSVFSDAHSVTVGHVLRLDNYKKCYASISRLQGACMSTHVHALPEDVC